ncbi:hypothetical protein AVEN_267307-1 [Araneus ventricosus]|uniref:Uncharacterized protein n=1 Tax=Araneus ventricosus TaxID=182803 RepID=A0A4Y2DJM4_ARAVE|nr:hypothetical protein AVEN_267307-1 [Araneus ventricosus]
MLGKSYESLLTFSHFLSRNALCMRVVFIFILCLLLLIIILASQYMFDYSVDVIKRKCEENRMVCIRPSLQLRFTHLCMLFSSHTPNFWISFVTIKKAVILILPFKWAPTMRGPVIFYPISKSHRYQ